MRDSCIPFILLPLTSLWQKGPNRVNHPVEKVVGSILPHLPEKKMIKLFLSITVPSSDTWCSISITLNIRVTMGRILVCMCHTVKKYTCFPLSQLSSICGQLVCHSFSYNIGYAKYMPSKKLFCCVLKSFAYSLFFSS